MSRPQPGQIHESRLGKSEEANADALSAFVRGVVETSGHVRDVPTSPTFASTATRTKRSLKSSLTSLGIR